MEKKALVVEYEPRYVQRLTSVLHEHGFEVMVAMDGEEALKKAKELRPDLVFLSAVIPKLRSSEVVLRLRSIPELAQTRIVLLATGIREEAIEDEKRKKGVDSILSKPFSETRIIELIDFLAAEPPRTTAVPPGPRKDSPSAPVSPGGRKLTSEDLFGEILEGRSKPAASGAAQAAKPVAPKAEAKNSGVDELLQRTLSDLAPIRTKKPDTGAKPSEPAVKIGGGLDRRLSDTLSGLDLSSRSRRSEAIPPAAGSKAEPPRSAAKAPMAEPPATAPPTLPPTQPWDAAIPASVKDLPADIPAPASIEEPVPAPAPREEGQQFGNYLLIEKLATGGMAEIYKAKMSGVEGFQKEVAIKRILPQYSHNQEFTTMFIDEAKLAAQLSHRNIVHIYDLGKLEDSYFIAMEHVEGTDLRQVLIRLRERGQRMPVAVALYICGQIASALDYAHKKQDADGRPLRIVHRDVSPQNILIGFDGQIKICDFGIAKAASKASHTRAGSLKGKLQYMSPEQAWGRPVDYHSDLFSLAVVLFELLSGRGLFDGESELSILEKVRNPKVEPLSGIVPEIPPEIDRVVQKALQERPEQRYPEAALFARDLEEILSHYAPRVTEKSVAQCLAYLDGQGALPVFSYIRPSEPASPEKAVPRVEVVPEETSEPAETVMEKEEGSLGKTGRHKRGKKARARAEKPAEPPAPVKPPEPPPAPPLTKMEEKEETVGTAETTGGKKKLPMAWIGAGAAAVLLMAAGIYFLGGKKNAPQETPPVQSPAREASAPAQVAVPATAIDLSKAEPAKPAPAANPVAAPSAPVQTPANAAKPMEQAKPAVQAPAVPPKATPSSESAKPIPPTLQPKPAPAVPPEETKSAPAMEAPKPLAEAPMPAPEIPQKQPPLSGPFPPAATPPAAAPQFKTGDTVTTDTPGLAPPRLLKKAMPTYPPMARMQKIQGEVTVQVLVDENGRVADAKVLSGPSLLHGTAQDAAKSCEFRPAQILGVKVKCAYTLVFTFKL